jgi:general secretion pathway protein D
MTRSARRAQFQAAVVGCALACLGHVVTATQSVIPGVGGEKPDPGFNSLRQEPAEPKASAVPPATDVVPAVNALELSGQLDLARLIDLTVKQLGVAIEFDAAALRSQSIAIRPTGPLDNPALWRFVNRSLEQRGFVTVSAAYSRELMVVRLEDAARTARLESAVDIAAIEPDETWQPRAGFRNAIFKLAYVAPKEATEAIKAVLSRGVEGTPITGVGPVGSEPHLLRVSDVAVRIEEAIEVLRRIDTPDRATVLSEVDVTNLPATQVVATVSQLVAKRESVGGDRLIGEVLASPNGNRILLVCPQRLVPTWRALIAQADRRELVEKIAYTPRLFSVRDVGPLIQQIAVAPGAVPDDRFRVIVEEPTSTILVTATAAQHVKIRELLERLDAVPGESRRPMRSFVVRNRPIAELMDVLSRMIAAGALEADTEQSEPMGVSGISPRSLPEAGASRLAVADGVTFGAGSSPLLESARPREVTSGAAIRSGSAPSLPITLTADEATNTIIAIGDGRLLGQLETLLKTLDVRQPQVMLEVMLVTLSERDSVLLGVELQQLVRDGRTAMSLSSLFGLSTVTGSGASQALNAAAASGITGAVIRPGDFSIVVRALQSLGGGRTVSLPKVLLANNQRSQFDSLVQEPYGVSFTQGNSNSTNVTFGGTLDAGTKLSIKPQISEGDTVLLDYSISISSFGEQGRAGNLPPSRQVNSVQSLATVPDGYTVVVGGLDSMTDSQSTDQIPILGSIPVLGEAFKNQSKNRTRSRFYVLIRANVLRGQSLEALRNLSGEAVRQAGVPDSWPVSEPQIIK